jgi:REP element-mobilizing transposase RayT
MAVKFTQAENEQIYFCSFTCLDWMPLFEITDLYDKIYKWLSLLLERNHQIVGFVIMPNHLHLLIYFNDPTSNINTVLANGKRFLAYEIVKRLNVLGRVDILTYLSEQVSEEERKRKKKHRVFQPSSDIKPCYTSQFILQKLEYIHKNPVTGKWNLANSFVEYPHSSAAFYELNIHYPYVAITHYMDVGNRIVPETGDDT